MLSDIPRNACPECFYWDTDALTFTFHAKKVLAGQTIKFMLEYIDNNLEETKFPFWIEVDPIVTYEDVGQESDQSESEKVTGGE